jgi:hypothetical protein
MINASPPLTRRLTNPHYQIYADPMSSFASLKSEWERQQWENVFHALSELRCYFARPGDINPSLLLQYGVWPLLMSILHSDAPPHVFDEALGCLDGAVLSDRNVARLTDFPSFFAECFQRSNLSSLLLLLNITNNCLSDPELCRDFYQTQAFDLTADWLEQSFVTSFSPDVEVRAVLVLGRFLTADVKITRRSLLTDCELNRLIGIFTSTRRSFCANASTKRATASL